MWISQLAPEGRPRIPASRGLPCAPAVHAVLSPWAGWKVHPRHSQALLPQTSPWAQPGGQAVSAEASAGELCASSRLGTETPGLDREFLKTQNSSLPSVSSGEWFKCDYRLVY